MKEYSYPRSVFQSELNRYVVAVGLDIVSPRSVELREKFYKEVKRFEASINAEYLTGMQHDFSNYDLYLLGLGLFLSGRLSESRKYTSVMTSTSPTPDDTLGLEELILTLIQCRTKYTRPSDGPFFGAMDTITFWYTQILCDAKIKRPSFLANKALHDSAARLIQEVENSGSGFRLLALTAAMVVSIQLNHLNHVH